MNTVFLGMDFHFEHTKSSQFFIDILEKYFGKITLVGNENAWRIMPRLKADTVIIWQHIAPPEQIDSWHAKNVVIIPMYDACPLTLDFWNQYKKYKVFCFSKTLYKMLKASGFNCFHSQYYIEPNFSAKAKKSKEVSTFFWERSKKIIWPAINSLIKDLPIDSLHYHTGLSNNNSPKPNDAEIKKYNIEFSSWFEKKSDCTELLKQTDIYFAPRESEGIGLSFIEALAAGCLTIAYDYPTMNEYISNGKDGLLYSDDFKITSKITKTKLQTLKKASMSKAQKGYDTWQKSIPKIMKFIESPLKDYNPITTPREKKAQTIRYIKYIIKRIIFWKQIRQLGKKLLSH